MNAQGPEVRLVLAIALAWSSAWPVPLHPRVWPNGALQNVAIGLLDEHVGHCVANAAAAGDQNKARDMITEATRAIAGII